MPTFGEFISQGLDLVNTYGQMNSSQLASSFAPQIPVGTGDPYYNGTPAKVTVDTRTGKVTPCRRRRRRKMLTEGDMCQLFQIATLPNNANVRTALARAIKR